MHLPCHELNWSALALSVLALAAITCSDAALAQDPGHAADVAAQKVAAGRCAPCHGPAGVSTTSAYPRLAGQQELYFAAQLKAFKAKVRSEPEAHDIMWGMATPLDDAMIDGLARYYAAQKPGSGKAGDAKLIARGKVLFESGDTAHNVAACSSCHGLAAEGATVVPRLAGQHATYVVRQLDIIQKTVRASPVMHGVIKDLDADSMKAVAEYVQSM